MNLWPFKALPSFDHTCLKCGQHMIKPDESDAYCVFATCEDGAKNHEQFKEK